VSIVGSWFRAGHYMYVVGGSVGVEITVEGVASADELRNLRTWLLDEPELRGRVILREALPQPGEMGAGADALVLALAGGGAVLAATTVRTLSGVLITWLKSRTSRVEVTVRRADGSGVTLSVTEVRKLSTDEVARMLDELVSRLGPSLGKGDGDRTPGDALPRPLAG
jgi:Effector Associated Constant Component 1